MSNTKHWQQHVRTPKLMPTISSITTTKLTEKMKGAFVLYSMSFIDLKVANASIVTHCLENPDHANNQPYKQKKVHYFSRKRKRKSNRTPKKQALITTSSSEGHLLQNPGLISLK